MFIFVLSSAGQPGAHDHVLPGGDLARRSHQLLCTLSAKSEINLLGFVGLVLGFGV